MTSNVYEYGNTIRLNCTFKDFDGENVNPENVKIIIYDSSPKVISTHTNVVNDTIGEYHFDYTLNNEAKLYYYEWYGEIEGVPSVKRGDFRSVFHRR